MEKYNPLLKAELREMFGEHCREEARLFFEDLEAGRLSGAKLEITEELAKAVQAERAFEELVQDASLYSMEINLDNELDITEEPFYGFDSNYQTLFIKSVPKDCPRKAIEGIFKGMEGYTCLSLSEPLRTQEYVRFGWVIFKTDKACLKAFNEMKGEAISEHNLNIVKNKHQRRFIKILSNMTESRLNEHLSLSKELITVLDREKQITDNQLLANPNKDPLIQLDLQTLYLRKVHYYCYYSASVSSV